jgi:glycosyltransferase involved in cell wall biosynthesis
MISLKSKKVLSINKKISIITVVKNDAVSLEKTLASILDLDDELYELIIIDGKSTDETINVLRKYKNLITKLVSEPDSGIYNAMNKGIVFSTCNYLMFLNAGDTLYSAENLKEALKNSNSTGIFFYSVNIEVTNNKYFIKHPPKNINWQVLYFKMPVCHQSIIYSLDAFRKYGCFDEQFKIAADYEWILRYFFAGEKIYTKNLVLSNYAIPGYSLINKDKLLIEKLKIVNKYFPLSILNYFVFNWLKRVQ